MRSFLLVLIILMTPTNAVFADTIDREYALKNGPRIFAINSLMCGNPLNKNDIADLKIRLSDNEHIVFMGEYTKQLAEIISERMKNALEMRPFLLPDCDMLRAMKEQSIEEMKQ